MASLRHYLALHRQNLLDALRRLASQPFASLLTVLVIAIALALPAGLRDRDKEDYREEHPRGRGRVAHAEPDEGAVVDEEDDRAGRVGRPAARHYEDLGEDLKGPGDGDYRDEERGRTEQRKGDEPDPLQTGRAVPNKLWNPGAGWRSKDSRTASSAGTTR